MLFYIRQRGIGNTNSVKMGRCAVELNRIYGVRNGGDRGNQHKVAERNNFVMAKTQADVTNELGLEVRTMQNYMKLTTLIPELEDLVEAGIVTPTTASTMLVKLLAEEQLELVSSLDV